MFGVLHLAATMFAILQIAEPNRITGTLADRPTPEAMMAQIELRPSEARDIPGVSDKDRVFRANTPQFRPPGSPGGLTVAWVEAEKGTYLYVDKNLDGRLEQSERTAHTAGAELALSLAVPGMTAPLPFRCRVMTMMTATTGERRRFLSFSAAYRVEGHAEISGKKTLVSVPFNVARNLIDLRQGKIGVDTNGDGAIDLRGMTGPEMMFARGERVMFRVGEKYVSFESADMASRRFVLREHSAEEYPVIEIQVGTALPDFSFTDFDGKARRLSDFRGKYLLIDVWGSWCKPCVDDVPILKAAYDRFKDQGFEILGIDYEHGAAIEQVRALLKEKNVGWPNALPTTVRELVHDKWRIMGFPTLFLLNPDGVVIETNSSLLRGQRLASTLERVLEKR